jgi:hypothetical protein
MTGMPGSPSEGTGCLSRAAAALIDTVIRAAVAGHNGHLLPGRRSGPDLCPCRRRRRRQARRDHPRRPLPRRAHFAPGTGLTLLCVHRSDRCRDPLYLLQAGIKRAEPITAAIVPSLPPMVAYLLQLPVGRLKASALTLAGVLAIVILVARHDARNGSSSASQSASAAADPSQATRTR